MPSIIGKGTVVVEHDGLTIEELAGNVATKNDALSIAKVTVSKPTSEPWLTIAYDEWICITKGKAEFHSPDGSVLTAVAGDTVFVAKNERFRPIFPEGATEYFPVCLPAFAPDRCIREEEGVSDVATKLAQLHEKPSTTQAKPSQEKYASIERLYHMCQKSLWDAAVKDGRAYFPPTYVKDGMFTHATAVPQRLITTANHFYTSTVGDWICLVLNRPALLKLGIDSVFEEAKPVGEIGTSETWDWVCPHVYGGIPTHIDGVVLDTYDMKRTDGGNFLSIVGLTDV